MELYCKLIGYKDKFDFRKPYYMDVQSGNKWFIKSIPETGFEKFAGNILRIMSMPKIQILHNNFRYPAQTFFHKFIKRESWC